MASSVMAGALIIGNDIRLLGAKVEGFLGLGSR